jgi:hypothetical protein
MGWRQDCALKQVTLDAIDDNTDVDPNVLNTLTGTEAAPVTMASCQAEAVRRTQELWSYTDVDGFGDTCKMSNYDKLSSAVQNIDSVTAPYDITACGACPTVAPAAASWPGADVAESNIAFGSGQPFGLQCWPKRLNPQDTTVLELMGCGATVVQTTDDQWPGTCNNLDGPYTTETTADSCRVECNDDPFCSVWMFATPTGATAGQCFRGVGNDCWTGESEQVSSVEKAERVQHGLVNVLMDDFGVSVNGVGRVLKGLQQQFREDIQVNGVAIDQEAQKRNCMLICHSSIDCTFWQSYYHDGQGTVGDGLGCWIEAPGVTSNGRGGTGGFVDFPTTTAAFADSDDVAIPYVTGGQYIQHYCTTPTLPARPQPTTTTTTTTVVAALDVPTEAPPSGGFMNPWGYMIMVAAVLVGIAAMALIMLGGPKKPPAKKASRAVKPIKAKETPPPPAPPAPQQPVVPLLAPQVMVQPTIPQPLTMTTIQQPTTIAAQAVAQPMQPLQMATYAGAPFRPY